MAPSENEGIHEGATANVVVPGYTRKDAGRLVALDPKTWQLAAKALGLTIPPTILTIADEVIE